MQTTLTAEVRFAAVHLTGSAGTEIFSLARLRRTIELMSGAPESLRHVTDTLRREYPAMTDNAVYRYVLAARKCINHGVEI